jgi:uncharacterized protein YegL
MIKGVRSIEELKPYFSVNPSGGTPLNRTLSYVLSQNQGVMLGDKKLLIIIVTDGEPTDGIDDFKQSLQTRNDNVFTNIVACTDDDNTMNYLNGWDRVI